MINTDKHQRIVDNTGIPTAVIVPIEEYLALIAERNEQEDNFVKRLRSSMREMYEARSKGEELQSLESVLNEL